VSAAAGLAFETFSVTYTQASVMDFKGNGRVESGKFGAIGQERSKRGSTGGVEESPGG
jgi:hypothetical protein